MLNIGFENARGWLADVRAHADPHLTCILVGNKVDLCANEDPPPSGPPSSGVLPDSPTPTGKKSKARAVTTAEGLAFADEEGLLFVEASAKSGAGVQLAFERACVDILSKIENGVFDDDRVRSASPTLLFIGADANGCGSASRRASRLGSKLSN